MNYHHVMAITQDHIKKRNKEGEEGEQNQKRTPLQFLEAPALLLGIGY